jgi:hypothetical protein
MTIKKSACSGCYNNFYNQGGVDGKCKECFSLKRAKMVWCKVIPIDVYPREYYRYPKEQKPSCYHKQRCSTFTSESPYYHAKNGDYE